MSKESESDSELKEEEDTREGTSGAKAQSQSHGTVLSCDWRDVPYDPESQMGVIYFRRAVLFHAEDLWVLVCFPCLLSSLRQQTIQGMFLYALVRVQRNTQNHVRLLNT